MSNSVDVQRLAATVFASLLLHLCLLAIISKGLPGIGRPAIFNYQAKHSFQATMNAYPTLQNDGESAASRESPESSQDSYHALQMGDELGRLGEESERQGLPAPHDVFDGPPYPPPEPTYWPATLLEHPPQPMAEMDTRFQELEGLDAAGRMVFSLLIDEEGHVDEVLVEFSSLNQNIVDHVQAKLLKMRFQGGRKSGVKVKSRTRIEVNFSYSVL